MLLESETDLRLVLGLAAVVAGLLALLGFFLLTRTAIALRAANEALSKTEVGADRTERRMFTILQAIPVALVETDMSGKFTFANRAAHQLLGRKDSELLGLRFHSATWGITYPDGRLIPPDLLPAARALRGQTVKGFQHLIVNPNTRKKMLVSVTAMPILNDDGEVIGSSSAIVETEGLTQPHVGFEEELRPRYFDMAGIMLLAIGRDGKVRDINQYGAEMLGSSIGEIVGRDWVGDFLPSEDHPEARAIFTDIVEGRRDMPETGEGWIVRADGQRRLIAWRGSVVRDDRGKLLATLSSGEDVTEARAAEAIARETQDTLRLAQEAGEVGVWSVTPGTGEYYNSPAVLKLWGLPEDSKPDPVLQMSMIHPDDRARAEAAFQAAWNGETPSYACEYRITRPDGEVRWIAGRAEVVRDAKGKPQSVRGVGYDITDLKTAEAAVLEQASRFDVTAAALADSEARFESFAEALGDTLWMVDLDTGKLAFVNAAYDRMWGESRQHLIDDLGRWRTMVTPEDAERVAAGNEALSRGEARDIEFRIRRADTGEERVLFDSAFRVLGQDGKPRWLAGIARDITDQRRAEEALKDSEARFRTLVEVIPQLVWSTRPDGWRDYVSPGWAAYCGGRDEDFFGVGWQDFIHPDDRPQVIAAWNEAVAGHAPYDMLFRLRGREGGYRWFQARAVAMRDDESQVIRWFGATTDVTDMVEARETLERRVEERTAELQAANDERRKTEAALAQSQRLETVGRLTGGVAHDFNNLLTVVIGALDMILRQSDKPDRVKRLGEAALAASKRGERLTRQLLTFSRRQEFKAERITLEPVIRGFESLMRRAVEETIPLNIAVEPGLGAVELDPVQLESALLNLVVNARDAVEEAGRGAIAIRAVRARLGENEITDVPAGDYVRISVMDTGAGMTPEVAQRALEPFYTTKEVGKGTGLGLAQVYGFARQSGGGVRIESAPGEGSTVSIYVPAEAVGAEPPVLRPEPEAAVHDPNGPAKGARVLLVEDDLGVRTVAENLLLELGCEVIVAEDGPSALVALDREAHIDLMLSDIVMPGGMSGVELAQAARAHRPELKVLLSTGYDDGALEAEPHGAWTVLRKPYQSEDLARAIRETLAREPA
jgi:PAS domain S-box-containing protein